MSDAKQCEFLIIRYVPDAVKDEFINIGVVVLSDTAGFADLRFTRDWRRVRCLDPAADLEMLQAIEAELRERLRAGGADRQRILHLLNDSFANAVQVSSPKALLTDAPEQELSRLAELYLESARHGSKRESSGRASLVAKIQEAFAQAGVWPLMFKKFVVSKYTHPGDPLKIDCGYRPNGVIRLFHAVSLATDLDSAKVLAFSFPQIREGIARVENAKAELTAIIEDDIQRDRDDIAFALNTLERSSISTVRISEISRVAEVARREMRV
jgi:hypothetical protein